MRTLLTRWLDLPEGRGGRALRMLVLVFLLSVGLSLIKSAQSGIFLSAYPRTVIPWAFAASSVVLAGASALLVRASGRRGVAWLGSAALVVSSVALLGCRALLEVHQEIVPFMTYVVIEAASGVLIIQVWSVASAATDARTARKLLPVAGIGGGLAWTVTGLSTGALVHGIGAENLLVVGAAVLLAAWALVLAVARLDLRAHEKRGAGRKEGSVLRALSFVNRVPLLRMMAVLSVLALITEEVMDYHLMSVARAELGDAESIAAFFGRYYAITSLLGVLLLAGPAARMLGALGPMGSLLATPLATAAVALFASIVPGLLPAVLLRGAGRVLKQTLWSNAQEQMTTPVAHARRAQARAATRGVLAPGGYAIAAVLLSLIPGHVDERWLAALVLALALIMAGFIVTRARRHYLSALERAVDARRLFLGAGRVSQGVDASDEDWTVLARELDEAEPLLAAAAAEVLAKGPLSIAEPALLRALDHGSPTVRRAAGEALGHLAASEVVRRPLLSEASLGDEPLEERAPHPSDLGAPDRATRSAAARLARGLAERLAIEPAPEVAGPLATALRRSLAHAPEARRSLFVAKVTSGSVLHASASASLRVIELEARFVGRELGSALLPCITSSDAALRSAALESITVEAADASGLSAVLRTHLEHGSAALKLEVAETIVGLGLVPLLPDVVLLLRDPRIGPDVARLLVELGSDAFEGDERPKGLTALTSLTALARRVGSQPGSSDALVRRLLVHRDRTIRVRAIVAMADAVHKQRRGPLPEALVRELLEGELRQAYRWVSILAGIAQDDGVPDWNVEPEFRFLALEVELRVEESRRIATSVLLLGGEHERVLSAVEAARRAPSADRDAYVAELLELTLPSKVAASVVPLFERLSLRERVDAARRAGLLDENAMAHPLDAIVGASDPLLRKVAALTYGERHAKRFPDLYEEDRPTMARIERMRFLRTASLFSTVPSEALYSVAAVTEELSFAAGEAIFHEDDPGEDLFLVMSGQVQVERKKQKLSVMGPGDPFGDLAVLDHHPRSADAICLVPTTVLRLRGADLRELMATRPEITEKMLGVVVARLRETSKRVGA